MLNFFEHIYPYKTRFESSSGGSKQPREEPKENEQNEESPRRSKRQKTSTSFGSDFVTFLLKSEPQTFKEAMLFSDSTSWKEAVNSEIESILSIILGSWLIFLQGTNPWVQNGF